MPDLAGLKRSRVPANRHSASQPAPRSPSRNVHTIRACRGADGGISYQDTPCADGSAVIGERTVVGDDPNAAQRSAQIRAAAMEDARRVAEIAYGRRASARASVSSSRQSADERCEAARVQAQRMREQHRGLPDIDWLRELDEWVRRECADTHTWTRLNTAPKG